MSNPMFYIAGPISGYEDYNAPAFHKAQLHLESKGILRENIFNPIISEESIMVQKGLIDRKDAYRICMKADLLWICDHATHMYMLNGWGNSPGAQAEHALAECLKLQIVYQTNLEMDSYHE